MHHMQTHINTCNHKFQLKVAWFGPASATKQERQPKKFSAVALPVGVSGLDIDSVIPYVLVSSKYADDINQEGDIDDENFCSLF